MDSYGFNLEDPLRDSQRIKAYRQYLAALLETVRYEKPVERPGCPGISSVMTGTSHVEVMCVGISLFDDFLYFSFRNSIRSIKDTYKI